MIAPLRVAAKHLHKTFEILFVAKTEVEVVYSRYRHIAIDRAKPAPSAAQIATIECLLGAQLPASFREFLSVANGGNIEYMVDVPSGDGKSEKLCFCSIFCTDEGSSLDGTFVGEMNAARDYQRIPTGVLPIARDGGGSMLFLDLSVEGKGRVVAFVEGLPEWTGLRTQSAFVELASSFEEYVDMLQVDRELVIDQLRSEVSTLAHIDATEEWLDIGMPKWREDSVLAEAVDEARTRVSGRVS